VKVTLGNLMAPWLKSRHELEAM